MDNQHIQKHIQTVREALSKATPGEWKGKHAITPYISVVTGVVDEVIATVPTRKNMHLIANAPTWLQQSIEIIEQQQREIERANLQIKLLEQVTESTRFMIEENVRLRAALTTIAEQDYPYAPMTDHSCLKFFIEIATNALPPKEDTNG